MSRSVSEIACGKYTAGHDMHFIAVKVTANTEGIEGTVRWEETAVFTSNDGVEYRLYNHRPEALRSIVERAGRCQLLLGNHFLWVDVAPELNKDPDSPPRRAVVNVSFEPTDPCGATISEKSRDSKGMFRPIHGGN